MEAVRSSSSNRHETCREVMRQRLADVTRRIRWTYSILWCFCPEQQVLVWGEGYLDGAESTELSLHRSQQLRNLYNEQLSSSVVDSTTVDLLAAPPNLTPMEWFYVGSMALIFATGDGLPGQALGGQGHVWHCITNEDDNQEFVRAHLAQRARFQVLVIISTIVHTLAKSHHGGTQQMLLQCKVIYRVQCTLPGLAVHPSDTICCVPPITIVCIPALDGVLEFGTTALVEQDPNVLQQMKSIFLEQPTLRISSSTMARDSSPGEMRAFKRWKTAMATDRQEEVLHKQHRQQMLKTALLTIPRLYAIKREVHATEDLPATGAASLHNISGHGGQNSRRYSGQSKHVKAERKRREELNGRFDTLRRLVPFVAKPTRVSLLGGTIDYVVDLQRQVEVLESTAKIRSEKPIKQDVEVTIEKSMAILKISCAWQDSLLIDILQKMADLQLEVVDANAEVSDDTLNATLKAKVRSSDRSNEENQTAEIQAALLTMIEGKLRGKAVIR